MRVIWKFPLQAADHQTISMPLDATILSVGAQRGAICLWAMVDDAESRRVDRPVQIVGTGHNADGLALSQFVGSAMLYGGDLVFHVFVGEPDAEQMSEYAVKAMT